MKRRMGTLAWVVGAAATTGGCGAADGIEQPTGEVVGETRAAATSCDSPPGTVAFYTASGTCSTLGWGAYPNPEDSKLPNDSINYVHLGLGMRASLFSNAHFGGTKTIVTANMYVPVNTSSIRVEYATDTCEVPGFVPPPGAVAVYHDTLCRGDCNVLYAANGCWW